MSFFPRTFITSEPSFTPLFRLLDEFDNHYGGPSSSNTAGSLKTFQPKFDVKENAIAYELHGELPGIEQKDVEIEFTDIHTLTVRGRTERHYESGSRPSEFVEGSAPKGTITEAGETKDKHNDNSHQPTVEDEDAANTTSTEITKHEEKKEPATSTPESKYWVSERSVGEFSRSFSFPARVDQDAVKASMNNGILSIVVPKAKKHEGRKITISS